MRRKKIHIVVTKRFKDLQCINLSTHIAVNTILVAAMSMCVAYLVW